MEKSADIRFVRDRKEEERIKRFCIENGLADLAEQIRAVYIEVEVDADG